MKTDIALQQNCDQSVKIWRSTQSSTWHQNVSSATVYNSTYTDQHPHTL
jgi:hypothetical protein